MKALLDEVNDVDNPVVRVIVEAVGTGNLDDVVLLRREPPHTYQQVKYAVDSSTPVNTAFLIKAEKGKPILQKIVDSWHMLTQSGDPVDIVLFTNRAPDLDDPLVAGRDSRRGLLLPNASLDGPASVRGRARAEWAKAVGISEDELIDLLSTLRFDIARDPVQFAETISHAMGEAGLRNGPAEVKAGADWIAEQVRNGQRGLDLATIHNAVDSMGLRVGPVGTAREIAHSWSSVLRDPPLALIKQRPETAELRQVLLQRQGRPVVVTGMGGAGKSVMITHLARTVRDGSDLELAAMYPAGVAWVTVGRKRPVVAVQAELAQVLGGDQSALDDDWQSCRAFLRRLATGHRGLLVLDDVWTRDHWEPFRLDLPDVQILITTRNQDLADALAYPQVLVGELGRAQARELLASLAAVPERDLPEEAAQILTEVGYLALGVAMIGGMVRQHGPQAWPHLLRRLQAHRLDEIASWLPDGYEHSTLLRAVDVAVDDLDAADQERWAELAVFAGQGRIPESAMTALWQSSDADELAGAERIGRFLARSLVQRVGDGHYQLHDLQSDVALLRLRDDAQGAHERLINGYAWRIAAAADLSGRPGWSDLVGALARMPVSDTGWRAVSDDYLFDHLAWHLSGAGRNDDLHGLLTNFAWLQVRLESGQLAGLISDYGFVEGDRLAQQIARALRLSATAVTCDVTLLRSQITARLAAHPDAEVRAWAAGLASEDTPEPWLMATTPALTPVTAALRQTLTGHTAIVSALAITPNGQEVVSGGLDGSVRVLDLATGTQIHELEGISPVHSLALVPDGSVAVGTTDGSVLLWDTGTGARRVLDSAGAGPVRALAVTPDGTQLLAAVEPGGVLMWSLDSDSQAQVLADCLPRAMALTPDGRCVIVGGRHGTVTAWDLSARSPLWESRGHLGSVRSIAASADGQTIITAGFDGSVRTWNRNTGSPQGGFRDGTSQVVTVVADRKIITGDLDGSIRVWHREGTVQQIRGPQPSIGKVWSMAVTADGTRLLTGGDYDGSVRVWDLQVAIPAFPAVGGQGTDWEEVRTLAVTGDGRILTGSRNGCIEIQDPDAGSRRRIRTTCTCSIDVLAVTPEGMSVVAGSDVGHVRLIDLETGEERWASQAQKPMLAAAAVTADGKHAVTGSTDGPIYVWELASGKLERMWAPNLLGLTSLAITPDSRQLVSAGKDASVRIWDFDSGTQQYLLTQATSDCRLVTVSPDGKRIVTADVGGYGMGAGVRIWNRADRTLLVEIDGHVGVIRSIAVSEDSSYLATAGADSLVHVWRLETGQKIASWRGEHAIRTCAVLPGEPLRLAVLEEHGQPYLLELRQRSPDRSAPPT